ncbi:MAG: thioredoxin family protein [Lentisphaeria bacterium]|nr:thioredoxin family protein [Lentisphaeria bacterium]
MKNFFCTLILVLLPLFLPGSETAAAPDWQLKPQTDKAVVMVKVAGNFYLYADSITFNGGKLLRAPVPVVKEIDGEKQKIFPPGVWQWEFDPAVPPSAVNWQACSGDLCMPPQSTLFTSPPAGKTAAPASSAEEIIAKLQLMESKAGFMDKQEFTAFLNSGTGSADRFSGLGLAAVIVLTLLGGFALNLTPCVLPMIPINLAIIGASGGGRSAAWRGACYGAGMMLVYGLLGVLAAVANVSFGTLNSTAGFNFAVGAIFLIMALAMAGVFNLSFSGSYTAKLRQLPLAQGMFAFLMGGVSALLAGACVAPVVISVLLFSAHAYGQGNWWALGLPFILGLGMALPWPLAGWGIAILPKPGKFMVVVKYAFAVLIFGAAVYYTVLGIGLLRHRESAAGDNGIAALQRAIAEAKEKKVPVLVEFTASWCKNCAEMERSVLPDPDVQKLLQQNFVLVKYNAENPEEAETAALLKAWNVPGFPAFVKLKVKP